MRGREGGEDVLVCLYVQTTTCLPLPPSPTPLPSIGHRPSKFFLFLTEGWRGSQRYLGSHASVLTGHLLRRVS